MTRKACPNLPKPHPDGLTRGNNRSKLQANFKMFSLPTGASGTCRMAGHCSLASQLRQAFSTFIRAQAMPFPHAADTISPTSRSQGAAAGYNGVWYIFGGYTTSTTSKGLDTAVKFDTTASMCTQHIATRGSTVQHGTARHTHNSAAHHTAPRLQPEEN